MADPLSVAGLAVGVVSLGIQVYGGIANYIDALECRDRELASARQQNGSLLKLLHIIEASIAQVERDHHAVTSSVSDCLDSCKKNLKALDEWVAGLTDGGQPITGGRSKIRAQGKKLLYPFSRPKLAELDERLRNANATLQLALQVLGLSVSRLGAEKLVTLESASRSISAGVVVVQTEIAAMNAPLQGIQSTLSGFETRLETRFAKLENIIEQLVHQPAINGTGQGVTLREATGRLLTKPAVLRDICDATGVGARLAPNITRTSPSSSATQDSDIVLAYRADRSLCICRSRRRLQRKNLNWGSFIFSLESATEQHFPGCPLIETSGAESSRKVALTYTGIRRLLNSAVQLSFAMTSGAGGWSISPNFIYYPTVDRRTAPTFRILELLRQSQSFWGNDAEVVQSTGRLKLERSALASLLRLFRSGKASPRAVDHINQSLAHALTDYVRQELDSSGGSLLLQLFEWLAAYKAPVYDYDIYGGTPLSMMLSRYYSSPNELFQSAATVVELIVQSATEVTPAFLSPRNGIRYGIGALHTLRYCSSKAAEALDFGPLSLAILANDQLLVEHLLSNHPTTLDERNIMGHTPLHLAAVLGNASILRHLVQVAQRAQLDRSDYEGVSALEAALASSRSRCRENNFRRKCRRCRCAECAVILLKADCAVPTTSMLGTFLASASQRCKLKYIHHMRDRRNRLRQLALDNLALTDAERLGLLRGHVLDSTAEAVFQALQHRNVQVPDALVVTRDKTKSILSIYQILTNPSDADLFFRLGYHDIDSWFPSTSWAREGCELEYVQWLAARGADVVHKSVGPGRVQGVVSAHRISRYIGGYIQTNWDNYFYPDNEYYDPRATMRFLQELRKGGLKAAALANSADGCRCACSPGGCSPLTYLFKGLMEEVPLSLLKRYKTHFEFWYSAWIIYLRALGNHLELRHHITALRFAGFTMLDLPHTCYDHNMEIFSRQPLSAEDIDEVEAEHGHELALLEEISAELEEKVKAIFETTDQQTTDQQTTGQQTTDQQTAELLKFWEETFPARMKEVRDRIEGSNLTEEERRGAEQIGVVWKETETAEDNQPRTVEFYLREIERIEAECQ